MFSPNLLKIFQNKISPSVFYSGQFDFYCIELRFFDGFDLVWIFPHAECVQNAFAAGEFNLRVFKCHNRLVSFTTSRERVQTIAF